MALTVNIDLGYEFEVKAKAAEVFEVLADVPTSVSHFPKVDKLTDMGGGVYKWEMEKVGTAQVNIQTVYASKYTYGNKAKGTAVWQYRSRAASACPSVGGHWTRLKESTPKLDAIEARKSDPAKNFQRLSPAAGPVCRSAEMVVDTLVGAAVELSARSCIQSGKYIANLRSSASAAKCSPLKPSRAPSQANG